MIKLLPLLLLLLSCSKLSVSSISDTTILSPVNKTKPFINVIWSKNLDPDYIAGNLPIALNSPVIHENILFAGGEGGIMSAYQLNDGRVLWKNHDGSGFAGKPTIYKDLILYGNLEGRFYGRLWKDGALHYEVDLGASIESAPVVYKDRVFVHLRNHRIYCLDVETGKILWAYHRSIPILTTLQNASAGAIYDNSFIVGFADGYLASLNIEDGVIEWEQKISDANKFMDIDLQPLIWKDKLVIGSLSGELIIMNPKSGSVLQRFPYQLLRSPVALGDRILFGTNNGNLVMMDQFFKVLSETKLSAKGITDIVSYKENYAVLTLAGEVIFLDQKDLSEKHRFNAGHTYSAFFADAAVSGNYLAVLSSRFRLYILN